MNRNISERIKEVSGIQVKEIGAILDATPNAVYSEEMSGRTVFVAMIDGEQIAFSIDGTGEEKIAIAKLVQEIIRNMDGYSSRSGAADPVREFLLGHARSPMVRVGKRDYCVLAVYSPTKSRDVYEHFSVMAGGDDLVADMSGGVVAFCKRFDGDDYNSAGEFAYYLYENLMEEIDGSIKFGVGGIARGISELPTYYGYADSALKSGTQFDPNNSIYSYKEYALISLLSGLPTDVKEKYVKTALEREFRAVLADEELMLAADAFITHSLNIADASRSLFLHRNTLIYRINKIEKLTGLNIRNFNDAMAFRAAYLISKTL